MTFDWSAFGELFTIDDRVELRYFGRWIPARIVGRHDADGWPSYAVAADDLAAPILVYHDSCTLRRAPSGFRS